MAHRPFAPFALLTLLAGALMLPVALAPAPLNDSHWINLVWSDQFTALLRQGEWWPRWLPWSHDGLGAPVFYFYGPVPFWIAGVLGLVGFETWPSLIGCAGVALVSSGVAAYTFLEGHSRRPLAGAIFYMAAPYHLLDFARRGALAEFTAIALLPLVMLGIRRAVSGRPVILALAYATLIMTHLPTALLASLFLLPLGLATTRGWHRPALIQVGIGLTLGLGLAAAYLLPAILLQPFTAIETMHGARLLNPANWGPTTLWRGSIPGLLFLGAIALAHAGVALVALLHDRDPRALFVLAMAALALGLAAPFWLLPPLDRVQFPWRVLSLAELGIAMLIARSTLNGPRLLLLTTPTLLLSSFALAPSLMAIGGPDQTDPRPVAGLLHRHPDVIEYLPRGVAERAGSRSDRALALAARTPANSFDGQTTIVRRFYFPGWQVRCGNGLVPTMPTRDGLLAYAGRGCTLERVGTLPERLGFAVSFFALLALALILTRAARARVSSGRRPLPIMPLRA